MRRHKLSSEGVVAAFGVLSQGPSKKSLCNHRLSGFSSLVAGNICSTLHPSFRAWQDLEWGSGAILCTAGVDGSPCATNVPVSTERASPAMGKPPEGRRCFPCDGDSSLGGIFFSALTSTKSLLFESHFLMSSPRLRSYLG